MISEICIQNLSCLQAGSIQAVGKIKLQHHFDADLKIENINYKGLNTKLLLKIHAFVIIHNCYTRLIFFKESKELTINLSSDRYQMKPFVNI